MRKTIILNIADITNRYSLILGIYSYFGIYISSFFSPFDLILTEKVFKELPASLAVILGIIARIMRYKYKLTINVKLATLGILLGMDTLIITIPSYFIR